MDKWVIMIAPRMSGKRAFLAQGWVRIEAERERILRARLAPCRADLLAGVKLARK